MTMSDDQPLPHQPYAHLAQLRAKNQTYTHHWRRETEIDAARQRYLADRLAIQTDIKQNIYPFKDVRLNRADIEWLLEHHDGERGPVVWVDESQRERIGLDLSGADLRRADLHNLPLARLRGGIGNSISATDEQRETAAIHLDGANLTEANLEGSDLRYAHLERANLSGAYLQGADLRYAHLERAQMVGAHIRDATLAEANLYRANLGGADLERSDLSKAFLRQADFQRAHLQEADFRGATMGQAIMIEAHLERADLSNAHLERAILSQAHLGRAVMTESHLEGAILSEASLGHADLWRAHLIGTVLYAAQLEGANLSEAHLDGAVLGEAQLRHANLGGALLRGADLRGAHLEGADLRGARLHGITLWVDGPQGKPQPPAGLDAKGNEYWAVQSTRSGSGPTSTGAERYVPTELLEIVWQRLDHFPSVLQAADLRLAFLDSGTRLDGVILSDEQPTGTRRFLSRRRSPDALGCVRVADLRWNHANLSVVNWSQIETLGDERVAKHETVSSRRKKTRSERLVEYDAAIRANRQLAIALQEEGLDEVAVKFTARAQKLEVRTLWWRHQYGDLAASAIFNWIASVLAGYGYKPLKSIVSYVVVVVGFALAFLIIGPSEGHHYSFWGWLVLSVTSFHGRGLFPATLNLEEMVTRLEALEAVVGLFVEVSFIAIYTKRFFFGK